MDAEFISLVTLTGKSFKYSASYCSFCFRNTSCNRNTKKSSNINLNFTNILKFKIDITYRTFDDLKVQKGFLNYYYNSLLMFWPKDFHIKSNREPILDISIF